MKKSLSTLIAALFIICCFSIPVLADGSWVLTQAGSSPGSDRIWKQYTGTADASDGSFPDLTVTGFYDFYLFTVETWPGAVSPADASDYTLSDATTGEDLMGATGTDGIDATSTITKIPYYVLMDLFYTPLVKGNLSLAVSQGTTPTNSAIINVRITGAK